MITRREFFKGAAASAIGLVILRNQFRFAGSAAAAGTPLDPKKLSKYLDPLVVPPVMSPTANPQHYQIGMYQFSQQLHSQLPPTKVWGYGSSPATAHYPAFTIEARRNVPITVKWTNNLLDDAGNPLPHLFTVDQTLHWADPLNAGNSFKPYTGPVPTVVHVHGADVLSTSDGHPDAWFTPGYTQTGKAWQQGATQIYSYPNNQPPTTIWYHDHALGITRQNVLAGLAGFFLIRDPAIENEFNLPGPAPRPGDPLFGDFYEIPMAIQDRKFDENGQLMFPSDDPTNPGEHPFWVPEFFGNTMLVNGVVWPRLNVEPRKYRLRLLDGCNARFLNLALDSGQPFIVIGSDGGYLPAPVQLNELLMGPGERYDVIVDFTGMPVGKEIVMTNNAKAPFPDGDDVDGNTGVIMKFVVVPLKAPDTSRIPASLVPRPELKPGPVVRSKVLFEVEGPEDAGPLVVTLDGKMFDAPLSEHPELGTTEVVEVINTTQDTHPMHWHLVQFQVLNRQTFNADQYKADFINANPGVTFPAMDPVISLPVNPYLDPTKPPDGPRPQESGWKDTAPMWPGEVTRIAIRYAHQDGTPFSKDFAEGPGYVWHCHIVDHEDNEMMRPYKLFQTGTPINSSLTLLGLKLAFSATPAPNASAGVTTITATFRNRAAASFANLFFTTAILTGDNVVLNADGGPAGVGSRVTVLDDALGVNGFLDPNETFSLAVRIGMSQRLPFRFLASANGVQFEAGKVKANVEDKAPGFEVNVDVDKLQRGENEVLRPNMSE